MKLADRLNGMVSFRECCSRYFDTILVLEIEGNAQVRANGRFGLRVTSREQQLVASNHTRLDLKTMFQTA